LDFDFDGVVSLRFKSESLSNIEDIFKVWQKPIERPDLTMGPGDPSNVTLRVDDHLAVSEKGYQIINSDTTYEVGGNDIIFNGPVDYDFLDGRILQPVLNRIIVPKGWCFAHASAVSSGDSIAVFAAMGGTGKTNLLIELLGRGLGYMGDDKIIVSRDGRCLLYPHGIHLLNYNCKMFPEVFEKAFKDKAELRKKKRRLARYEKGLRMSENNPLARWVKNQYTSRFYISEKVPPERLFPHSRRRTSGKATHVIMLRSGDSRMKMTRSSSKTIAPLVSASTWLDNNEWLHSIMAGLSGMEHHTIEDCTGILSDFLDRVECYEFSMGRSYGRNDLVEIADEIESLMGK